MKRRLEGELQGSERRLEGVFRAIKLRFEPGLNLGLKLGLNLRLNLGLTWISTWLEPGFRLRAQIFTATNNSK